MKTYKVFGFALATVGVEYADIEANSGEEAMEKAKALFDSGDVRLTQDIDENTAYAFDPIFASVTQVI